MRWQSAAMVLGLVSLTLGFLDGARESYGADPGPCPQFQCKTVYCWWPANQVARVNAYKVPDTQGQTNSSDAQLDIYATVCLEKLPLVNKPEQVEVWGYPTCSPTCGKDGNNNWQAPQEVVPTGTASDVHLKFDRIVCSQNGGNPGPQDNPPTNNNTANPPGYSP